MKNVFISYAKEDFKHAKKLYNDLKKAGISPWLDKYNILPGQNWKYKITKAIENSIFFIAVLSSNSLNKKGYVQKELKKALDILDEYPHDKEFIIPVRIEDCIPEDEKLQNIHFADLFEDYDFSISQIIQVIKQSDNSSEQLVTAKNNEINNELSVEPVKNKITQNDNSSKHINTSKNNEINNKSFVKPVTNKITQNENSNKQITASKNNEINNKSFVEPFTKMKFVWIEGGCYMMGQTEKEKEMLIKEAGKEKYDKYYKRELPRHEVCVDGFWLGKYPVTVGQFKKFVEDAEYVTDAEKGDGAYVFLDGKYQQKKGYYWKKTGFDQDDDHPVVSISWNDA